MFGEGNSQDGSVLDRVESPLQLVDEIEGAEDEDHDSKNGNVESLGSGVGDDVLHFQGHGDAEAPLKCDEHGDEAGNSALSVGMWKTKYK